MISPFIMRSLTSLGSNASLRRISFVPALFLGIHFISSANAFSPPSSLMTSQRCVFSTLSLRLESPTVLNAIAKTREAECKQIERSSSFVVIFVHMMMYVLKLNTHLTTPLHNYIRHSAKVS